jgi:antitoxin FitA
MEAHMAAITVRKIPDEMHRALKARAKKNARSTEAEARAILAEAVMPQKVGLGTALYLIGRKYGGIELDTNLPGDLPEYADFP